MLEAGPRQSFLDFQSREVQWIRQIGCVVLKRHHLYQTLWSRISIPMIGSNASLCYFSEVTKPVNAALSRWLCCIEKAPFIPDAAVSISISMLDSDALLCSFS
jgi:hypothetical protein